MGKVQTGTLTFSVKVLAEDGEEEFPWLLLVVPVGFFVVLAFFAFKK